MSRELMKIFVGSCIDGRSKGEIITATAPRFRLRPKVMTPKVGDLIKMMSADHSKPEPIDADLYYHHDFTWNSSKFKFLSVMENFDEAYLEKALGLPRSPTRTL
jgi:hypothetical protein